EAVTLTGKLLEQAKQVVSGNRIIADRIVSFYIPRLGNMKQFFQLTFLKICYKHMKTPHPLLVS
ncbi:hypothetical protein ACTND9_17745, partial [Paenibacillus barengoltzii]|uniref:hypothetical protein n=1 Tax=Paenibacillus barengoltzii TaxID=343517 RepID=UPI003F89674C